MVGGSADTLLRGIQNELVAKPDRGAMVSGLGGIRKARMANPARGKGKRGGFRYLYLYLEQMQRVHLMLLLDENEQEDLNEEQRRQVREWVEQIKKASGA